VATHYRVLTLPAPVNSEQADAHDERGVLTITLPKAQPERASQIKVRGGDEQGRFLEPGSSAPKGS